MKRPPKAPAKKTTPTNANTSAKAVEHSAKIKTQKIDKTGLTSRVRGHVSAAGKRSQGKRDAK